MNRATAGGRSIAAGVALLLLALATTLSVPSSAAASGPPTRWIVQLAEQANVGDAMRSFRGRFGVRAGQRFGHVLKGFSASLTPAQQVALAADPRVTALVPDLPVHAADDPSPPPYPETPDEVQPGIVRVGATANPDRAGTDLDVDIAIVDTGIQPDNPELNVVGGYNCMSSNTSSWADDYGHGTHVSGIAAAIENGRGVAGVAQGARLWAIKVLDQHGGGSWSSVICGLDHVAGMRDADGGQQIEVVNMSLSGGGLSDDGDCGRTNTDLLHQAVCRLNDAGVTMVVAAGNDHHDAAANAPAAYDEVITVSAMADWNGEPRNAPAGLPPSSDCTYTTIDDGFASFSNYGPDVDLIAPGVCVLSTVPTNRLDRMSGTSMATPHVTGGAALYYVAEANAGRPRPTPQQVRAALIANATTDWQTSTDRDSTHEPALNVAAFNLLPSFQVGTDRQIVRLDAGSSTDVGVWVARLGGFDDAVDLSVDTSGLPGGATASFGGNASTTGTTASIEIDVPAEVSGGRYVVRVDGSGNGQAASATFTLLVSNPNVDADGPTMSLRSGVRAGASLIRVQLAWPTVAGAAKYQVAQSVDGSDWASIAKPYAPNLNVSLQPGQRYQFRVRARVSGAWRSWHVGPSGVVSVFEASGALDLSGTWDTAHITKAYSELPIYSTATGATATFEFSGHSVAWIASRGRKRGRASVKIDGVNVATANLHARRTKHRSVVFSTDLANSGTHTLTITVLGAPATHPRIDIDTLAVISN